MTAKCSVASTVLLVSLRALDTMPFIPAARGCAEGQVQASLFKRGPEGGLLNSARISLMEGMLPSRFLLQVRRSVSSTILSDAGTRGGKYSRISLALRASDGLQRLRLQRRLAQDCEEFPRFSLQIRTLHRQEFHDGNHQA